jgi:hypothetical protein
VPPASRDAGGIYRGEPDPSPGVSRPGLSRLASSVAASPDRTAMYEKLKHISS